MLHSHEITLTATLSLHFYFKHVVISCVEFFFVVVSMLLHIISDKLLAETCELYFYDSCVALRHDGRRQSHKPNYHKVNSQLQMVSSSAFLGICDKLSYFWCFLSFITQNQKLEHVLLCSRTI